MRYLGIDFGSKRVGLALSDESNKLAFPFLVLANNSKLLLEIEKIINQNKITCLVVGESTDFKGLPNKIMKEINIFSEKIKQDLDLPIFFEPEFMTSAQAEQIQGKNKMNDASAAAIILQTYLDKLK
jgi:putative Holliday junction resolvase